MREHCFGGGGGGGVRGGGGGGGEHLPFSLSIREHVGGGNVMLALTDNDKSNRER